MANKVCHWEFRVRDLGVAKEFYGAVFGWEFTEAGDGYNLVKAGDGIGGGMFESEDAPTDGQGLVYLEVDDIDDCLTAVEGAGGTIEMPKHVISEEHGAIALFRDPSGLKLGIWAQG